MNKKVLCTLIIFISIILIIGGVYLKMKHDEKKEREQQYYDGQKKRIELFMKYNVKGFKKIHFSEIKKNPMDGYDISGNINDDEDISFTAGIRSTENFQFDGDITSSAKLEKMYKKDLKSVSEIKKEQENKRDEN
ncbi:DUF1433 domain-containing protein [Staphylococcus xylosus]|uniref:DUF1433 domain-containing protein n=3 Tax=Staphylococcus xylosus TaxID=1288 RepID=A0AAQ0RYD4_STAXY|nr:DUF1433 domain-containing protein [Staphylococcus xylosus]RIM66164.1 DUF1433 domain-containing protein [Staphylococcus xylosus]RIM93363.1 DUF1433 domain-containing protein [Staphylococcus xylosus]